MSADARSANDIEAAPPLWRQCLIFAFIFAGCQGLWTLATDTAAHRIAIDLATVQPAAWLIRQLTPAVQAVAAGSSIRAPGGGLNILNGCEGLEVLFLLAAALSVAPLGARHKLLGALLGALCVWLLNQLRIVGLFYAYRADPELFALLHGTVAPLALVVLVSMLFLIYLRIVQRDANPV